MTFRLEAAQKAELMKLAKRDRKSLGELLRDLAHERIDRERRSALEIEARRQCLEAAAAAKQPGSDEHAVMRELEDDLDAFEGEWK